MNGNTEKFLSFLTKFAQRAGQPALMQEELEGNPLQESAPDYQSLLSGEFSPFEILKALMPHHRVKRGIGEEHQANSLKAFQPKTKTFAQGGLVNHKHLGHIKLSNTGGQADDIRMRIPEGSYVANATDLSLLGDGSTDNGVKKIMEFESKFARSGIHKPYDGDRPLIDAKVSNDEYVISPSTIDALGKGDNKKGAKIMDKMRNNLRKQKGVKAILPPKTKDIHSYMKGGR